MGSSEIAPHRKHLILDNPALGEKITVLLVSPLLLMLLLPLLPLLLCHSCYRCCRCCYAKDFLTFTGFTLRWPFVETVCKKKLDTRRAALVGKLPCAYTRTQT